MADVVEIFADGTVIERDFTEQEKTQIKLDKAANAEKVAKLEELATAKAALLTQLGITEEQAKLLLS